MGKVRKVTEYEVAEIDDAGDAVDINHHETLADAIKACKAVEFNDTIKAAAVGKIVWTIKHNGQESDREDKTPIVHVCGCPLALAAGEWTVDE